MLKEFLDPLPLPIMALAVFGIVFFWLVTRCFRLPDNFQMKEAVREEIRFKLFDKEMNSEDEEESENEGEGDENAVDGTAGEPPSAAPPPSH